MPVAREGRAKRDHLGPWLHWPVQADQVADVDIQPRGGVIQIGHEAHGITRRADIGILIHLQRKLNVAAARMVRKVADTGQGKVVDRRIVRVADARLGPEPGRPLLRVAQRTEEADADMTGADLGGGVDDAMAIGQMGRAVFRVDDAAARGGDGGDGQLQAGADGKEFRARRRGQIGDAQPGIGRVHGVEPGHRNLCQALRPDLRPRILNRAPVRQGAGKGDHRGGNRPVPRSPAGAAAWRGLP